MQLHKHEHTTIDMPPNDARKGDNEAVVRANIEINMNHKRKYPALSVGDRVNIYQKTDKHDKEMTSARAKPSYGIERTTKSMGQTFYHRSRYAKPLLRHELLNVSASRFDYYTIL